MQNAPKRAKVAVDSWQPRLRLTHVENAHSAAAVAHLKVCRDPPKEIIIDKFPFVLGRAARCDCQILDMTLSASHALFRTRDQIIDGTLQRRVYMYPLGSNGCVLNGKKAAQVASDLSC